eukprot:SAG31_NODE_467_length_15267_cov_13.792919_4_plen_150_part_00
MRPWWIYTHLMQIPRKFVQFLPPLVVGSLLKFLEDPSVPAAVGLQLTCLAAIRMICDKLCQAHYLFTACNAGFQPALTGARALVLAKLQVIYFKRLRLSLHQPYEHCAHSASVAANADAFTACPGAHHLGGGADTVSKDGELLLLDLHP